MQVLVDKAPWKRQTSVEPLSRGPWAPSTKILNCREGCRPFGQDSCCLYIQNKLFLGLSESWVCALKRA